MDPLAVQRTRYVLRARFRLALKGPTPLIAPGCAHALAWLDAHPIFGPIMARLSTHGERYATRFREFAQKIRASDREQVARLEAQTAEEHAALCLAAVRAFAIEAFDEQHLRDQFVGWIYEGLTGEAFRVGEQQKAEAYEVFRDVAVDGLYDYLDEQLDARNVLYAVLLKYQRRSEWFARYELRDIAKNGLEGKRPGERSLAVDLQRYVFDQGVDFSIEETSASGEPDLVLRDSDDRHVIIDAKYVPEDATHSKVREKIATGLNQVAIYCENYQEPAGFLVVFYEHSHKPRLPLETRDGLSFFTVRSVAVYFILVNLYESASASKAGTAEELVIDREQLLREISDLAVDSTKQRSEG